MNLMEVNINNGFWKERKELNKNTSLYAVLKTFVDSGRVRALTGDNAENERPHILKGKETVPFKSYSKL